jgi:hypothetical protein
VRWGDLRYSRQTVLWTVSCEPVESIELSADSPNCLKWATDPENEFRVTIDSGGMAGLDGLVWSGKVGDFFATSAVDSAGVISRGYEGSLGLGRSSAFPTNRAMNDRLCVAPSC